jgi:hypothetical protein
MKNDNTFWPWANEEDFEKALAAAPDWAEDEDAAGAVWSNCTITAPGKHPFTLNSTPIVEQLGAVAAKAIVVLNADQASMPVTSLLPEEKIDTSGSDADLVLLFVREQQDIDLLLNPAAERLSMTPSSILWICHSRQQPKTDWSVTALLQNAEALGLNNDAVLRVAPDWVCLRLQRQ